MVAEERITTKFCGLVGAHGSEEEATFLATQQVDEARHMQFYARFQDEVVADAGRDRRARRARARAGLATRSAQIFDDALVEAHEQLVAAPGDLAAKVRFVTLYHLVLEGTLGLTSFKFITDYLNERRPAAGLRRRLLEDPPRRDAPHRLRRLVPARDRPRRIPRQADVVRATLRDLLPAVAESLKPPGDGDASAVLGVTRGRPARSSRSTA